MHSEEKVRIAGMSLVFRCKNSFSWAWVAKRNFRVRQVPVYSATVMPVARGEMTTGTLCLRRIANGTTKPFPRLPTPRFSPSGCERALSCGPVPSSARFTPLERWERRWLLAGAALLLTGASLLLAGASLSLTGSSLLLAAVAAAAAEAAVTADGTGA